ncbi:MAG: hypothetical protein OXI77_18300 [Chloroflexota bacterium]|nr:hypothetical protein [Chloroflexota bacterium]MDE2909016.1 hypothetical protein [Chloroflexota bacterium]
MRKHNKGHPRPDFRVKPRSFDEGVDNILRIMEENRRMLLEINAKLDAIMEHLDVPPKPPAGFVKE